MTMTTDSVTIEEETRINYHGIKIHRKNPAWLSDLSKSMLHDGGYVREGETISQALARPAVNFCFGDYELAQRIYDFAYNNYFMYASPVMSNATAGTWHDDPTKDGAHYWHHSTFIPLSKPQGQPISCFAFEVPDSIIGQEETIKELARLSVSGGGTGAHNAIRATTLKAPGPIPYEKLLDSAVGYFRQNGTRKGALAYYLNVDHPDIKEHVLFRVPGGDTKRRSDNRTQFHSAVNLTNEFIAKLTGEDPDVNFDLKCPHSHKTYETVNARLLWEEILETRALTGEPYLMKIDLANERMPETQKTLGLKIGGSNLCFTGDTLVAVADGRNAVSMRQLYDEGKLFDVYSARKSSRHTRGIRGGGINSGSEWTQVIRKAKAVYTGRRSMVRVHLDDGDTFDCTPDHQLATTEYGSWVEAEDSVGSMLEPFFTTKDSNYRCINSTTSNKQHLVIWKHHHGTIKEGHHIDHINRAGGDHLSNLQSMSRKKHLKKTVEEITGSGNNVHTLSREEHSQYASKGSFLERNSRFSGFTDKEIIKAARMAKKELKRTPIRAELTAWFWQLGMPVVYSKNRFQRFAEAGYENRWAYMMACAFDGAKYLHPVDYTESIELKKDTAGRKQSPFAVETEEGLQWVGRKVVRVEHIGKQDCYDVSIVDKELNYDQHNFYILTSGDEDFMESKGVLVHNCSEITLPTDEFRTFVCCLSSLNLERFDDWEHTTVVEDLIRFLDNVVQWFVDTAPEALKKAKFSAERERALGLGTFGWHSYLQKHSIPLEGGGFNSSVQHTHKIFGLIRSRAEASSLKLGAERGEAPDMKGTGRRNSRLMAIAPNANSADIANTSPSCEPWYRNVFVKDTRAGVGFVRNPHLDALLTKYDMNTKVVWKSIADNHGSVQHLAFLSEHEKKVFRTAMEMDQHWLIELADARGQYVDQAQSLNLFFPFGSDRAYVNSVHLKFVRSPNVLTLYYFRTERETKVDNVKEIQRASLADWSGTDCVACQG